MSEPDAASGGRRGRPGSPRARLFVALEPAGADRERLAEWRDLAVAGRDDLRPIATEALHLTLVFLGYRPEKEIASISELVRNAVRELHAARLTPVAVKPIPPRAPRLFAVDFDDDEGRAASIQAAASDALAGARVYRPEKRPFWPHLTFARVKRGRRAAPVEAPPPRGLVAAPTVTLFRSHLSPRGAIYEPLERVTLRS